MEERFPHLQSQDDLECSDYGRKAHPGAIIVYALGALVVVFALAVWIVL